MQAIVISVDYGDYLKWTLPANYHQFQRMVVVTEEHDELTQRLCRKYDVHCIVAPGNKGQKINAALRELDPSQWTLQLDADIWLPPQTVRVIERRELDKEALYGCDRLMCRSYDEFIGFLEGEGIYLGKFFTTFPFPTGVRVCQHYGIGYLPIGYFQLWHPLGSTVFSYPEEHDESGVYARTDVQFAIKFKKRNLLAETVVIHLESGEAEMGANWNGRTTPRFGPGKKEQDETFSGYKN
jgi:hypothetical protein